MASAWLEGLNPAQREAVTFGEGPVLVVAGAGTGKTRTLACRVAQLTAQGIEPGRILLLTFTRRAAAEMIGRADQMTGRGTRGKLWGGTFHALANRLLRIYGRSIGLSPDFTVMDQGDAADLMNLIRNELGVAKGDRRFPRKSTLVRIYSYTVNAQNPLGAVVHRHFPWCEDDLEAIASIFEHYVQRKTRQQMLDFDDLLLYWKTLCAAPGPGERVADRFDHILVDEYQDTNAIQADILRGMRKKYDNVMAVGDDAQSIYSFRAATIRNILDFPKHFPGAHVVTLEKNYRSTQPILAASNAVMTQARERFTKDLFSDRQADRKPILVTCADEEQQTGAVCGHILEHLEQDVPLLQQAVLFRAGHHSAELEIELARRNIPFHKFGGLKFLEAAHIKDMLAFLRILDNPFDEISWFRVLSLLPGIGPRTAQRIMGDLSVRSPETDAAGHRRGNGSEFRSPLKRLILDPPSVSRAAEESFAGLQAALADCGGLTVPKPSRSKRRPRATAAGSSPPAEADCESTKPPPVAAQIERISGYYKPICERVHENAAMRLRDVEQLEQIARRYRSRRQFVTDLTLDPPDSTSSFAGPPRKDEDYLTLSTIHSAKGCEWTVVHIIHAADGMIPSDMATEDEAGIEEERRMFYVAMTRAKDALYVYFPLRYYHTRFRRGDSHSLAQLTRFMTASVRKHFAQRAAGEFDDDSPGASAEVQQVQAWLNRLWGG